MNNILGSIVYKFKKHKVLNKIFLFTFIISAIISVIYIRYTFSKSITIIDNKAMLLGEVAEASLNGAMVKELKAIPEDDGTVAYESIKTRLIEIARANKDIRFAYIYTKKYDKIYFMVDSEPKNSKDYFPPGQEYIEANSYDIEAFKGEKIIITKPSTDRWGTWISVLVPMKNNRTDDAFAVFGVDYLAESFYNDAKYHTVQAIWIVFFVFLLLISLYRILIKNVELKEAGEEYQLLLENIQAGVVIHSIDTSVLFCNFTAEKLLGLSLEQMQGKLAVDPYWKFISENGETLLIDDYPVSRILTSKKKIQTYILGKVESKIENNKWFIVNGYPIFNENEQIKKIVISFIDITEIKKNENLLIQSEEKHKAIVAGISDVIGIMGIDGIMKYKSPNITKWFGWLPEELVGTDGWETVHPEDIERLKKEFNKIISEDNATVTLEYKYKCKDGNYKPVELTATNMLNNSAIQGVLLNYHDITKRKLKDEEVIYISNHDRLTGLYRRSVFDNKMRELRDTLDLPISIIVGDINGLKLINDIYGLKSGDGIIIKTSKIIEEVFGVNAYCARLSGGEFAIMLFGISYEQSNLKVNMVKKICEEYENKGVKLSISFGVATKTEKEQSLEQCRHLAEERMYTSKLLESKSVKSAMIANLRATMEEKTGESKLHCERMFEMARKFGIKLGMQSHEIEHLKVLALLHDIGKTGIPDNVILKPGTLTVDENKIMRKHCEIGYRIANTMPELVPIADGILSHHERWDGGGYPQGLVGVEIPLMARIVSVLDTYDAMTNDRPYRKACSINETVEEIKRCSGTQFDPSIVKVFIEKVLEENVI